MFNLISLSMKKLKIYALVLLTALALNSCATVFIAGNDSTCQKTKPAEGQPQRDVRVGLLILDILLFWPGAIIDFATCEIYKPCK